MRDALKAQLLFASVEYPQGNGVSEGAHRVLKTAIKYYPPEVSSIVVTIVVTSIDQYLFITFPFLS